MRRLSTFITVLGLMIPGLSAHAQPSPNPQSHPGVWQDVMKTPHPEGAYGMGYTSTERVVERCTALLWSIRTNKDGSIRKYARYYQSGYCLGWINSSMAFLNFHNEAGNHTLGVCMPEDMDSKHVIEVFLAYVHNNPEQTKYNPSLLIYWSLLEKYPCAS